MDNSRPKFGYELLSSGMKHLSNVSNLPIISATYYAKHVDAYIVMEDNGKTQADLLLTTHMKMGHFGMTATRKHLGLKTVKSSADDPTCHSCEVTRAHATQMQGHTNKPRADAVLKRIFMDIGFGRMSKLVFQVYLDDHSRRLWVTRLKDKGDTLKAWIPLQRQLQNDKQPRVVAVISRDNDPVYTGNNWKTYAADHTARRAQWSEQYRLWAAGQGLPCTMATHLSLTCSMPFFTRSSASTNALTQPIRASDPLCPCGLVST